MAGQAEQVLLDALLERLQEMASSKPGAVLAPIRPMCSRPSEPATAWNVSAKPSAALNDLAVVAPDWLRQQISADWFERYGKRFEESRLPKGEAMRDAYAEQIGTDGLQLLNALYHATAPRWIREMPIVEILRQTWVYQDDTDEQGRLRWRTAQNLPPAGMRMDSPYDPDAHCGINAASPGRGTNAMTETCEEETLHVMTHVETPEAAVSDVTMTEPIHHALADKQLAPATT